MSGFAWGLDDTLSAKACPGGSKFGNQKTFKKTHLRFGFPLWLVQVEANLNPADSKRDRTKPDIHRDKLGGVR